MKLKRITALVLAIVMTIGMFPVYTSAQEGASTAPTVTEETVAVTEETVAATAAATETAAAPTEAAVTQAVAAAAPAVMSVAASYQENVGKRARFDLTYSNFPIVSDPTAVKASGVFGAEISISKDVIPADLIVKIVACYVNEAEGLYWYQVEAAEGCTLPAEFPAEPWVFQNYVNTTDGDSLIILPDPVCEICGQTNCTQTHVQCGICGGYDCNALHFYCQLCEAYDCGRTHLYCNLCEAYDCAETHVWCGTCGSYDCGKIHEDRYTPATEPVIPVDPVLPQEGETFLLDAQGRPVAELRLNAGEKTSVSAWSRMEGASYRWQVRYDSVRNLWVDIRGQESQGILVSAAMFLSLEDPAIRCVMTAGGEKKISDAIAVTVAEPAVTFAAAADAALAEADGDGTGDLQETGYVVVQYLYADGRTAAASDIANIIPSNGYSYTYALPEVAGYKATLENAETLYGGKVKLEDGKLTVNYAAGELTEEYTVIKVEYVPDYVNYTVIHYWQNVEDDRYTEHEREVISLETAPDRACKTGEVIANAHKTYPGFYNLLYETPAAAADGSTVIEVYYDRYYYLMKFELSGGFGVEPIYARYGTELEIGDPTKPGYEFAGWTDANGNAAALPDTMPANSGTYYAKWTSLETEYTVAYWIRNEDGSRVYVGSKIVEAESGAIVSGSDDLDVTTNTCGKPEHTHDACTMRCTLDEHTHGDGKCLYNCGETFHDHTSGCKYDCGKDSHTSHTRTCYNFTSATISLNAANRISSNQTLGPYNGFTVYRTGNRYNYRYYVQIGGSYYEITKYSGTAPSEDDLAYTLNCHTHSSDCCSVTYHDHTGCTCNVVPHIHSASCYSCETLAHTHTEACKSDLAKYVDFVEADQNVIVKGDGSTVVNVYYEYRTYTIRFIYAIANGNQYRIAIDTGNGSLGKCTWTTTRTLPSFEDPCGKTTPSTVTIDGYTCYYISLTAKFGESIVDQWPDSNIGNVEASGAWSGNGTHYWGSWATAPGTGYRDTYGPDHANIVGPYPVMSADMIVDAPELLADGTYLAQNMIAWWGSNVGWGNAANIQPHAYHNYFELLPSEDKTNAVEYNGKFYKLVETYTFTAAHNTDTRVDPIYFSGFKCINDTNDGTGNDKQANSGNFANNGNCAICGDDCAYCNTFYYDRNMHKLYFWNHNGHLMAGAGSDVPYGASLILHGEYVDADFMAQPDNYPDGLEPGAYQFAGWYTTADCHDGTEMDWNSTMPDADMTVYAKWVPVTRQVRFFLSQTSAASGLTIPAEMEARWDETYGTAYPSDSPYDKFETLTAVTNNTYLTELSDPGVAEGYEEIHPYTGYEFLGWFYVNEEGEEAAFDPANIPVTQDLDLYAKWSSNKLCQYNVYFALDADGNGTADVDEKGNTIYIADPISGSAIAGRTYTFTAKGGEELHDGYQEGYFPSTGSHSLVIDIADEDGTGTNSYVFLYQKKSAVPYTVKYLKKGTDEVLAEEKTVTDNKNVVVTENFAYISGYMPDEYQKTLVVTPEGTNEIIFYYTKDTEHALYVVNYYIQELTPVATNESVTWEEAGWTRYTALQNTGDIGTAYSAEAITIDGYTLSNTYTDRYNVTEKVNKAERNEAGTGFKPLPAAVGPLTDGKITGTLTDKGMELNFYYTRNLYPYEFRYMLSGTTTQLAEPEKGTAPFDTTVTGTAREIRMDLDGDGVAEDYKLYDPTETSKDIVIKVEEGNEAAVNVATFNYVRCTQTMSITKALAEGAPAAAQALVFTFSLQIHASGYHKTSYAYTKGTETGTLTVSPSAPTVLTFSLKDGETITIDGLPTAEYTVTELDPPTGYYPSYTPAQENTLTVDGRVDVTVTNRYEPAILEISKAVDVVETGTNTPEVQEFVFTVAFPEGAELKTDYTVTNAYSSWTQGVRARNAEAGTVTVALKNGETARFDNLPLGTYTVTEEDYSAQGYNSYVTVNDGAEAESRTASVELARGDKESVVYRNLFPVGDLVIEKTVTKEFYGTPWDGETFTFTVERTTSGRPLINGNQYEIYVDGTKADTNAVVADNKLQVTIKFDDVDAKMLDEKTEANSSVTHTLTIKNLPAGTYSVTEAEDANYVQTPAGLTVTGLTLPSENEVKAAFANQLIRPTGSLYLEKELVKAPGYNGDLDEDIAFSFTVELTEAPPESTEVTVTKNSSASKETVQNGRFTVSLKAGETVTVSGLPIGAYRITEATVPQYANAFAHKEPEGSEWVKQGVTSTEDGNMYTDIQVNAGATSWVKCTNTYPVNRAELIIQKLVEQEYAGDTLPEETYTFTVQLKLPSDDFDTYSYAVYDHGGNKVEERTATVSDTYSFAVSLEAGQYAVIDNMPVVGYIVSENVDTLHYETAYEVYQSEKPEGGSQTVNTGGEVNSSGTGTSVERTFVAGKTDTVIFTNTYKRHLTELTITKTGASTLDENQSFVFHVQSVDLTYVDDRAVDLRVVVQGNGSVTVAELPVGKYTVTEETDWSWRYVFDNTDSDFTNGAQITLDGEGRTLNVENDRTNPYWLSGADANKNIFDGTP